CHGSRGRTGIQGPVGVRQQVQAGRLPPRPWPVPIPEDAVSRVGSGNAPCPLRSANADFYGLPCAREPQTPTAVTLGRRTGTALFLRASLLREEGACGVCGVRERPAAQERARGGIGELP